MRRIWNRAALWLAVLALALSCAAPALAAPEDGVYQYVLDGAEVLSEYDKDALEERADYVTATYGFAPYVVTVSTLSGMEASDAALSYYDEYAMGAGDSKAGAILLVDAETGDYGFFVMNTDSVDDASVEGMEADFLSAFDKGWYEGFAQYIQSFASYFSSGAGSASENGGAADSGGEEDYGGAEGLYILDIADILTDEQEDALEDQAGSIAHTYRFAPCVLVVEDLEGMDAEDLAKSTYQDYSMGVGADNNGSLLLMSMEERDFWFLLEDHDSKVFDSYRYDSVQQAFLSEFKNDDWYGGFTEYLNAIEHYLSGAADNVDRESGEDWNYYGDYVPDYADDEGDGILGALIVVGIPTLISLLISLGMLGMMKTVHTAAEAGSYLKGSVNLRVREDVYTHTTESRVKVESDSDRGGGGSSSGGGGGGSFSGGGKF